MPESQQVVEHPTSAAVFLVLTVAAGREDDVRDVLAGAGGTRRSVGFRIPEARLSCVIGIGSALWDRLYGAPLREVEVQQPVGDESGRDRGHGGADRRQRDRRAEHRPQRRQPRLQPALERITTSATVPMNRASA